MDHQAVFDPGGNNNLFTFSSVNSPSPPRKPVQEDVNSPSPPRKPVQEEEERLSSKKRPREMCSTSSSEKCQKICVKMPGPAVPVPVMVPFIQVSAAAPSAPAEMLNVQLAPLHVLLNRDFIVTSPLKQNLLLTVALSERKKEHEGDQRLILVGRFRAFLNFRQFGLSPDAMRVRTEANAGGTSTISEALSVEYFIRRFQAKELVTEMEVEYSFSNWKKVDYICTLYGQRVGISVTRAMCHPDPTQFIAEMAYRLLHKKLFGLVVARDGVADKHCFSQCILHIWCQTEKIARLLEAAYPDVAQELEIADDVIMVLTVADGLHARPIFYEHCLDQKVTQ